MKKFAITPDGFTCDEVMNHLPDLKNRGVSFIYLRSSLLPDCLDRLIPAVNNHDILPVIPARTRNDSKRSAFGIHYRSFETGLIPETPQSLQPFITASCHDFKKAVNLLGGSAQYVFISPVFQPFSKPKNRGEVLSREKLKKLASVYGEKVVLLGGLNSERITALQKEIQHDFSVAGITMFFDKNCHSPGRKQ